MKGFLSDNSSGVDVKIMEALAAANSEHNYPYGEDPWTKKLERMMKEILGEETYITPVFNGTGANVLGLISGLSSYHCVLSVDDAHINVDECGAFEKITGAKIVTVPAHNGKLLVDNLFEKMKAVGNFHHNQPKIISISQLTELGTVYTLDEIRAIADFAHEHNMLLHVDGARIANACVSLQVSLKQMIRDTGVDILSLGGTKNGLMFGELIVTFKKEQWYELGFYRKQMMQLASKMRFISAQFLAYFEEDVFTKNALHTNRMGKLIYDGLEGIPEVDFLGTIDGNMLFIKLPETVIQSLRDEFHFYIMKNDVIRVVASFDTTQEECELFVERTKFYLNNAQ